MRKATAAAQFILGDHLGSTTKTVDRQGNVIGSQLYKPWGEQHYPSGSSSLATKYQFTGQFRDETGLYYYGARWYDSYLNRWTSPDTVIPDYYNTLDFDRYQYVRSNSLR